MARSLLECLRPAAGRSGDFKGPDLARGPRFGDPLLLFCFFNTKKKNGMVFLVLRCVPFLR